MSDQSYATIVQAQTIAETPGAWSQPVDFAQFDPSLGTLLNVNVGVVGTVSGSVSIESLEAGPASYSAELWSNISVDWPADFMFANAVLTSVAPEVFASGTLGTYDGTLDYGGISGASNNNLSNSATASAVVQAGTNNVTGFVGTGTVELPVTAATYLQASGPANMQIESHASAGAVVTLDYNYGAPGSSVGDGTAGSVFTFSHFPSIWPSANDWVTTPVQTLSVADATTGWINVLEAQQFDPALGVLEQVNITVQSDIAASVEAVNLDPTAGAFYTAQTATITLDAPGDAGGTSASTTVWTSTTLAASDGSTNFSGPAGFIEQGLTDWAGSGSYGSDDSYDATTITDDLAAYTGTGTVDLPIASTSTATVDGPGNLLAQLLAQGGATVTVSYTYQPLPVVTASDTVSYAPGSPVAADPGISLSDAGTSTLTSATVAITSGLLAGDTLSVDTGGSPGISASYSDGVLTLTGTASLADYQQVLGTVAFSSRAADPTAGGSDTSRTLTWAVGDDDGASSTPVASTIDVNAGPSGSADYLYSSGAAAAGVTVSTTLPAPISFTGGTGVPALTAPSLTPPNASSGGGLSPVALVSASNVTDPGVMTFQPALTLAPGTAADNDPLLAGSHGGATTAESLGLDSTVLGAASGAGPGGPDMWRLMTPTDIASTGNVLDILLNPADQRWVALDVPQGGALSTGAIVAGGPVAALGLFISSEHQGGGTGS